LFCQNCHCSDGSTDGNGGGIGQISTSTIYHLNLQERGRLDWSADPVARSHGYLQEMGSVETGRVHVFLCGFHKRADRGMDHVLEDVGRAIEE
jgi:hypothetical protein